MDVPKVGPLMGITAGLVWRGFETWSQISFRNRVSAVGVVRAVGVGRLLVCRGVVAAVAVCSAALEPSDLLSPQHTSNND